MTKQPKQVAPSEIRVIERAPIPAMRMVGATTTDGPATLRWTLMLVWFMRTMAVVWIAKGLFAWTIVLGINHAVADFLGLPVVMQAMVGFFAVANLMAAVGLWLAAPWGGVLWLICAATEIMSATLGAGASMTGALGVILDGALIAVYFALSWLAANERV
ncbi:DUF6163 family protein [Methylocapsa sp. S129]|uniref:DUF6163 family protein n=1 Tax=Methylocapsa sp. S129 TaxID=1641869 RepID=UPI00131B5E2D|nr:DUF6163 family protein [Methylocapsa sp. S129]